MDSLPVELLLKVLDELDDDPRDLLNASDSFGPLEDLLDDKIDACRLEEVLPLVLKWLEVKDVLNCRQISNRILNSVDDVLDNLEQLSEHRNKELIRSRFNPPRKARSFEWKHLHHFHSKVGVALDSLQGITRFRDEMDGSPETGRPFIGKRFSMNRNINWDWDQNYSRGLLDAGIQLMTQFQTKLAHVNLNIGRMDTSVIETYQLLLRPVFLAVPNLETFRAEIFDQWDPVHLNDLHQFIVQHPLPPMPLLKRISFGNYQLATPIYQEMVTKCGQRLECLQLKLGGESLREHPEYISLGTAHQFPALVEMRITLTWRMRDLLLNMEAPALVHLKLRLVRLQRSLNLATPPMPLLQFIQIFRIFPNLVELDLCLPLRLDGVVPFGRNGQSQTFQDAGNRHPNLKHLKVDADVALTHFPMRLWLDLFPNLETFKIIVRIGGLHYPDPDLNLLSKNMGYKSILWRMGGRSLQTIHFVHGFRRLDFKYNREEYNRRQQQSSSSCCIT